MSKLRQAHFLARLVLVWFALALGVAVASPLFHPQTLELVCSTAGTVKLVQTGDDSASPAGHLLDCPLCLTVSAPPPALRLSVEFSAPLAHSQRPSAATHIAARTAAPLPPRGPPSALAPAF